MIGPWAHSQGGRVALTGNGADPTPIDFGDNAPVDMNKVYLRWFDYILKGVDNGLGAEPPIRIFVMGDNYWRFKTSGLWRGRATPTTTF